MKIDQNQIKNKKQYILAILSLKHVLDNLNKYMSNYMNYGI